MAATSDSRTPAAPDILDDMRQLTLGNGRIIDLPVSILQDTLLKPVEFLCLEHHFITRRGASIDLAQCRSVDEAVEVLADEVESIRLLLYGYIDNFRKYVDHFEGSQRAVQLQVDGVAKRYEEVSHMAMRAHQAAAELQPSTAQTALTGDHAAAQRVLPVMQPSTAVPEGSTPTTEEYHAVLQQLDELRRLQDTMFPLRGRGCSSNEAGPSSKPSFTYEVSVALKKLPGKIESTRSLLNVAQTLTARDVSFLRRLEAVAREDAMELWLWEDSTRRLSRATTELLQRNQGHQTSETNLEDTTMSTGRTEEPDVGLPSGSAGSPDASPIRLIGVTASDGGPTGLTSSVPCPASVIINTSAGTLPVVEGDLYAVTLDMTCGKPFDDLSRDEAIRILKSLPARVRFVPYVSSVQPPAADVNASLGDSSRGSAPSEVTHGNEPGNPGRRPGLRRRTKVPDDGAVSTGTRSRGSGTGAGVSTKSRGKGRGRAL
ncbi:hypothetical protein BV20DRAFT_982122 [Pilatotrama ljubarskyi]|nr:hypothetical protein BV20DRAFT_982122 [Pilatotrama ljubarskyi]